MYMPNWFFGLGGGGVGLWGGGGKGGEGGDRLWRLRGWGRPWWGRWELWRVSRGGMDVVERADCWISRWGNALETWLATQLLLLTDFDATSLACWNLISILCKTIDSFSKVTKVIVTLNLLQLEITEAKPITVRDRFSIIDFSIRLRVYTASLCSSSLTTCFYLLQHAFYIF